jgi:bacterioferritin-associated ferredoxin
MSCKKHNIMCRCEDIHLEQIDEVLDQGFETFEDLKRLLRVGMGSCQASICGEMIQKHIACKKNIPIENVPIMKNRPMLLGVKLKDIVKGNIHE